MSTESGKGKEYNTCLPQLPHPQPPSFLSCFPFRKFHSFEFANQKPIRDASSMKQSWPSWPPTSTCTASYSQFSSGLCPVGNPMLSNSSPERDGTVHRNSRNARQFPQASVNSPMRSVSNCNLSKICNAPTCMNSTKRGATQPSCNCSQEAILSNLLRRRSGGPKNTCMPDFGSPTWSTKSNKPSTSES